MILTIGETYLEVDHLGKRKIAGDVISFLQASYLGAPSVYHGNLGEDENGKWLMNESNRLLQDAFIYFMNPTIKTMLCNVGKDGKSSFINDKEPFFMATEIFLSRFFEEFKGDKIIIDLSCSLLRKEYVDDVYRQFMDFKKGRGRPIFSMDIRWEKELFKGHEEEVVARITDISSRLDIIVGDIPTLKKIFGGKTDEEVIHNIPDYAKKQIFLFDKGKVYSNGKMIFSHRERGDLSRLRRYYYGILLAIINQDAWPIKGIHLAQDHFLSMMATVAISYKSEELPFASPKDLLDCIDSLEQEQNKDEEVVYDA